MKSAYNSARLSRSRNFALSLGSFSRLQRSFSRIYESWALATVHSGARISTFSTPQAEERLKREPTHAGQDIAASFLSPTAWRTTERQPTTNLQPTTCNQESRIQPTETPEICNGYHTALHLNPPHTRGDGTAPAASPRSFFALGQKGVEADRFWSMLCLTTLPCHYVHHLRRGKEKRWEVTAGTPSQLGSEPPPVLCASALKHSPRL